MRLSMRISPGMTHNANVIGRNVARFRYQKGWSQDLLVTKMQLLGIYITRDILANIENLRTSATDKQIVIFTEVFGVPVADLFPPKRKSSGRIVGLNS
jgi:transcriptional regulator with XRE-family HTH domain